MLHRFQDILERNLQRAHARGRHFDLVLADEAADTADLGHVRHGIELVADEPVLQRAQLRKIVPAFRCLLGVDGQIVLVDPAQAGGVGAEFRFDAVREVVAEIAQAFQDARAGEVVVNVLLEDHGDKREAEHGGGADGLDAGEALQVDRHRIGDLVLDFLGAAPRPIGEHDHLVLAQVRDRVHRRVVQGADAPPNRQQDGANHQKAVAEGPLNQPVDHGCRSSS